MLLTAACGSTNSHSVALPGAGTPTPGFTTRLNALCRQITTVIGQRANDPAGVVAGVEPYVPKLQALTAPASQKATYAKWLADMNAFLAALKSYDASAGKKMITDLGVQAVKLGVPYCGASSSSSTSGAARPRPRPQPSPLDAAEHGSVDTAWDPANSGRRLAIAKAWLDQDSASTAGEKKFETPADLVYQMEHRQNSGDLNGTLNDAAGEWLQAFAQKQLNDGTHGGGMVGKSMQDVRTLMDDFSPGGPDHEQVVGGQTFWYYTGPDPNSPNSGDQYQIVFDGNTVSQVNRYS
jgi:hypothetical protein